MDQHWRWLKYSLTFIFFVIRYSGPGSQRFSSVASPLRDTTYKRPFDDVAPPGTEGYYDLPPPGVDHPDKFSRDERDKLRVSKEREDRERAKDHEVDERERVGIRDERYCGKFIAHGVFRQTVSRFISGIYK